MGVNEKPYHEWRKGQVDLHSDCAVGSKVRGNLHPDPFRAHSLLRRYYGGSFSLVAQGLYFISDSSMEGGRSGPRENDRQMSFFS